MRHFWANVKKTKHGCWTWTGMRTAYGYGQFTLLGRKVYAHRLAYELKKGRIPQGLIVCHTCDNPGCVRPAHLFAGSRLDNNRDCSAKMRTGKTYLTRRQVQIIRTTPYRHGRWTDLAKRFGVSIAIVSRVGRGDAYKAVA